MYKIIGQRDTELDWLKKNYQFLTHNNLIVVIDWFSRYVISWRLSNTLEIDFCLDAYNEAIDINKNIPDIFNSDQGSHFTSPKFIKISEDNKIKISMDGRGRCLDNIFVERLWKTVKQENIYPV